MLDAFIIEELRRRERYEQEHKDQRPRLELPVDDGSDRQPPRSRRDEDDKGDDRRRDPSVVVIEL